MSEEKGNGGELIIILVLIVIVVAGAFYFMSRNADTGGDTGSSINIEIPSIPTGDGGGEGAN